MSDRDYLFPPILMDSNDRDLELVARPLHIDDFDKGKIRCHNTFAKKYFKYRKIFEKKLMRSQRKWIHHGLHWSNYYANLEIFFDGDPLSDVLEFV
jgi:hypothetical protein